jgi:hypothetical protein
VSKDIMNDVLGGLRGRLDYICWTRIDFWFNPKTRYHLESKFQI